MKNIKIKLNNVSVGYLTETVIHGLSTEIAEGEFVGLFGPNGAGKTTLLCAINGLAQITEGNLYIDNTEFNIFNENKFRRVMGYVPQRFDIDPKIPILAEEVVSMGRYGKTGLLRFPSTKDKDFITEVCALLEIQYLLKKPFGQLSGGERKRVLIARALVKDPEIMLFDEIFAWLDVKMIDRVIAIIREIQTKKRITTLMVSHDIEIIKTLCARIIWMEDGKIVFDGDRENFLKKLKAKQWN